MLALELETWRIPDVYRRFAGEIGDTHWRRRVLLLKQDIRGNRFLSDMLTKDNAIAFQLERLRESLSNVNSLPLYDVREVYPAAAFAAQVLSAIDALDRETAEQLRQRVRGAFKNPDDLRAMMLELTTATHFLRKGCSVTWPELSGKPIDGKSFDLLVHGVGPLGVEVECKSFSPYKGNRIGRRQALEFYEQIRKKYIARIRQLQKGVCTVITLPVDLPKQYRDRVELADEVMRFSLDSGPGAYAIGSAAVEVREFDHTLVADLATDADQSKTREVLESVSQTTNNEFLALGTTRGALVLAIKSSKDDELLEGIFSVLKTSSASQVTGHRPALFVVGVSGVSEHEMLQLAQQDKDPAAPPTALRMHVSRFLNSASRSHVVGVNFLGAPAFRSVGNDTLDSGGVAYNFPKEDSRFWSDDLIGLFRPA